ncbi:MAG TPA: sigma-70 family RNA polymerase sigma factor [Baekduia sp.]|uniref:sigma-70 family RNA polymerase sigma factor n=1 Tax=Baekduia sp. TaxID=2600305 RepID=UPI002C4D2F89|nr:sigma-70 family RNA polymerase sigma factor [Baekduia sp.]HMJ34618.1 sigma-70 family RNA polymerase sigma factor [Baekduia sp.]
MARVRDGDDTAFEAIYDRYARGLLGFCHHMLSNRDDAEDALQHSFGAAYRMLRSSDRGIELRPWLYTIARNRCLSLLRARHTEISFEGAPDYAGASEGVADQVQRRSDLRELVEDLRRLPDDQRAALVLFEFGGLPHDEIATVLDVRREKVKALVFQAREGLMRARDARQVPCTEMRTLLATLAGNVPTRSLLRRHVDRCPSCALFEAEVGRQRAGLALILPVLPTAGLKAIVLSSAAGRGAAVAGGGAGAGGGAAILGGASGGGGGLACAGAGGGAAGLTAAAGAGGSAAGGGAILAGAAAGGVSGTVATAGGAGTIAAALGAQSASAVVAQLLTVAAVVVGGGAAATGNLDRSAPPRTDSVPVVQQVASPVGVPSPAVQALLGPPAPVSAVAPAVAGSGVTPATVHDPLPIVAPDPTASPTVFAPATPSPAGTTPPPPTGEPPATVGPDAGATQTPAVSQPPTETSPTTPAAAPAVTPSRATPVEPASPNAGGTSTGAALPQVTTAGPAPTDPTGSAAPSTLPAAATPSSDEPAATGAPAPADNTPAGVTTEGPATTTPIEPPAAPVGH